MKIFALIFLTVGVGVGVEMRGTSPGPGHWDRHQMKRVTGTKKSWSRTSLVWTLLEQLVKFLSLPARLTFSTGKMNVTGLVSVLIDSISWTNFRIMDSFGKLSVDILIAYHLIYFIEKLIKHFLDKSKEQNENIFKIPIFTGPVSFCRKDSSAVRQERLIKFRNCNKQEALDRILWLKHMWWQIMELLFK